jgi:hypothetical protein
MPFPNEHAARLKAPGKYIRFRRQNDKFGPGIDAIFGVTEEGAAELQAVRFAKDKFTPEQARKWLTDHDHKSIAFEAAEKKSDSASFIAEDEVMRYDRFGLPGEITHTDEGFIAADPVVTRTGVFKYRMPDGTIRAELRTDEEVFSEDSLQSARMIPITNGHPKSFVVPKNASALAIGFTGENVRRDADTVRAPIKITTEDGIKAIEDGRRQLSLGYKCQVERKDGNFHGEPYTHVQRRIRYNHLALCDKARAGAQATLRLDADDAIMVEIGQDESGSRKGKTKMPGKVRLDSGIEYECPPEVEAAYAEKSKAVVELADKRDSLQSEMDKLQAKHDALEKEHEELKKVDNAEAIAEGVKARVALLEAVKPMLSEEDAKKADSMTDEELRIAAIRATDEKFDAEGKSDDYLAARFDHAAAAFAESEKTKREDGKSVIGDGSGHVDAEDLDAARQKMQGRRDGTAKEEDKK